MQVSDIENMIVHKPDTFISIPVDGVASPYRKGAEAGINWTSARCCWRSARIMPAS